MASYYDKVLTFVNNIISWISMIILSVLTSMIFLQVILRYVFDNSLPWVGEFARFLIIILSFLGISIAIWHGAHLKIDFFFKKLPAKLNKIAAILIHLSTFAFMITAFVSSLYFIELSFSHKLVSLPLNWGQAFLSFPLGIGLSILYSINRIIKYEGDF